MNIQTVLSMDTIYSADCIDFCPIESFQHLIVVGTYQLEKKENTETNEDSSVNERIGRLYLLSLETNKLITLQAIDMPGILDIRWCTHLVQDKIVLGVVDAKGMLIIYCLEDGKHLNEISCVKVCEDLSLYLDWSTRVSVNQEPLISVSNSKGDVSIYSFGSNLNFIQNIKAHQFEAWVTSFNYWNPSILYSGADDCKFKGYDIRSTASIIFSKNIHNAGVTSIQPSLWKQELLFSGCYNGDLNAWDTRNMKSPLSTSNLEGGVWRLRCEPACKPLMLASTMHNGHQIIEVNETDDPKIINKYSKHESLAYGADWSWIKGENKYTVGSVSFYDHLMCLWEFNY